MNPVWFWFRLVGRLVAPAKGNFRAATPAGVPESRLANPLSVLRELACGPDRQGGYSLLGFLNLSHSHPRLQLSTP